MTAANPLPRKTTVNRGQTNRRGQVFYDIESCVDAAIAAVGNEIVLGLPLGLGKANHVANVFFARAKADPSLSLHIVTALTLEPPAAGDDLSRRFLAPIQQRLYADYPQLDYAVARQRDALPPNITVSEFFFKPGAMLGKPSAQQHYLSSNYTHAVRDLLSCGINVVAHMLAPHPAGAEKVSLGCNTDVTLDLVTALGERREQLFLIGQINRQLPYLPNHAEVDLDYFDVVADTRENPTQHNAGDFPLFAVPQKPVGFADYAIAVHVASMIADGGTLQIGIGSLGDAVAQVLYLRQHHNQVFQSLLDQLLSANGQALRPAVAAEREPFAQGLYADSEMLVEGLLRLRETGILKRSVYADESLQALLNEGAIDEGVTNKTLQTLRTHGRIHDPLTADDVAFLQKFGVLKPELRYRNGTLELADGRRLIPSLSDASQFEELCRHALGTHLRGGVYCHSGFYIGSAVFYERLRQLNETDRAGMDMRGVHFVNQLYGDETLKRLQRRHGRFVNSAMMVALNGAVISDGLADDKVVSGVGGQYNFVAQAHELEDARAIICLPSTRRSHGAVQSNIVWQYPHTTIPRHLRDVVVTEYGAADLRGKSDRDVIAALLAITDSRFQTELAARAKKAGKLEAAYQIPPTFRHNTPERLQQAFNRTECLPQLPHYPLGTDFTREEAALAPALQLLKAHTGNKKAMLELAWNGWRQRGQGRDKYAPLLQRLALDSPRSIKDRVYRTLVIGALHQIWQYPRPLTIDD